MLFHDPDTKTPSRSPLGIAISIVVHALAGGAALFLAGLTSSTLPSPVRHAPTFVSMRDLPVIPPPVPAPRVRVPVPAPVPELARVALPADRMAPAPPEVESRRAELQPQSPQPKPRDFVAPVTPKLAVPPPVVVGAFSSSAAQPHAADQARQVQPAAFDVAAARAADVKLKASTTRVGGLEPVGAADPRPGSDRSAATVVADSGFGGTSTVTRVKSPATGTIGDAGFGDATANGGGKPRASDSNTATQVQPSGFGTVTPAAPSARPTPRPERVDVAVEVLSKPVPAYTDEARALKVEGDVLLEVDFSASGQVRVVRVVRGLGHGLDEAAARAARQIQFKPARSSAGPVDFRALVTITFRLT